MSWRTWVCINPVRVQVSTLRECAVYTSGGKGGSGSGGEVAALMVTGFGRQERQVSSWSKQLGGSSGRNEAERRVDCCENCDTGPGPAMCGTTFQRRSHRRWGRGTRAGCRRARGSLRLRPVRPSCTCLGLGCWRWCGGHHCRRCSCADVLSRPAARPCSHAGRFHIRTCRRPPHSACKGSAHRTITPRP